MARGFLGGGPQRRPRAVTLCQGNPAHHPEAADVRSDVRLGLNQFVL